MKAAFFSLPLPLLFPDYSRLVFNWMETFCLVIDESGAKGYADQVESKPGEFGVMIGFFIPGWGLDEFRTKLTPIHSRLVSAQKAHITDLSEAAQASLRSSVFQILADLNIKWVYEAVYVQGLHENAKRVAALTGTASKMKKSRRKISGFNKPDLLYSKLFEGVFTKAIAFGLANFGKEFAVKIITDPIDEPILKRFETVAGDFLHLGQKKTHKQTDYELDTGKVHKGLLTIQISASGNVLDDLPGISFSIEVEKPPLILTLAADVLSNSVYHHLQSLQQTRLGAHLNREDAIAGHPLAAQVRSAWTNTQLNYLADAVYGHPEA
jgi:hypothetical protein